MQVEKIDAVLKVTERCNINCTYCYMFNKESELYRSKPKQISPATVLSVGRFLAQSAETLGASIVRIVFHGGEPMMMAVKTFDAMCQSLIEQISPSAQVQFTMQTNAMLVDDEWVNLLERYSISVGVSLDGDRATNDKFRIDHRGRGTYDRTIAGVQALFRAAEAGRIPQPAVLCVIDPSQDGGSTFNHLAKVIGFKWMDFLLPIDTNDEITPEISERVGRYLLSVFDAWNELNRREVRVRIFDQFYGFMTGHDRVSGRPLDRRGDTLILTIESDGTYGPDDTLRVVSDNYYRFDTRRHGIEEYLGAPDIIEISNANAKSSVDCVDCPWERYCVGGSTNGRAINRFSKARRYEPRSGLCSSLKITYATLARALIDNGYPSDAMFDRLVTRANLNADAT